MFPEHVFLVYIQSPYHFIFPNVKKIQDLMTLYVFGFRPKKKLKNTGINSQNFNVKFKLLVWFFSPGVFF